MADQDVGIRLTSFVAEKTSGDGPRREADIGEGHILGNDPTPAIGSEADRVHTTHHTTFERSTVRGFGGSKSLGTPESRCGAGNARTAERSFFKVGVFCAKASHPSREKPTHYPPNSASS
jgi:hypothetical protein